MLFMSFCYRDIQVIFKICKLAKWWLSYTQPNLIKYDKDGCLNQLVSEMLDSLQHDSSTGVRQNALNIFVTMATY